MTPPEASPANGKPHQPGAPCEPAGVKCVVWDLDGTLWEGTLLEGGGLAVGADMRRTVEELDRRGILQSIASRNEPAEAMAQLESLGLAHYFLHPQVGWGDKSVSLRTIAGLLGIGLDTLALIDDQPFERDEVRFHLPEVMTLGVEDVPALLHLPRFIPRFVTQDAQLRRSMYQADGRRQHDEQRFDGPRDAFLSTLGMVVTIRRASEEDLRRAEELTVRANQLNTTGRAYSYHELRGMLDSPAHLVLVTELQDRYGSSGTVGLALIERTAGLWLLRLLIMSCRVLNRGTGGVVLSCIMAQAAAAGVRLEAEFAPTGRNRIMYVTYRFLGFREIGEEAGVIRLEGDPSAIRPYPGFVTVRASGFS